MKKTFLGFWGEPIQNIRWEDCGDFLKAYGIAQCPKGLLDAKKDPYKELDLNQMAFVPVAFEVSKTTNKKHGPYYLYAPEEIKGVKIPEEFSNRYSPLLFECTYQEDKLKGTPIFYDKQGKAYPIVMEKPSLTLSQIKNLTQKGKE